MRRGVSGMGFGYAPRGAWCVCLVRDSGMYSSHVLAASFFSCFVVALCSILITLSTSS